MFVFDFFFVFIMLRFSVATLVEFGDILRLAFLNQVLKKKIVENFPTGFLFMMSEFRVGFCRVSPFNIALTVIPCGIICCIKSNISSSRNNKYRDLHQNVLFGRLKSEFQVNFCRGFAISISFPRRFFMSLIR